MPQVSVLPDGGPVEACLEFLRKRARQLRTSISTGDHIKSKLNCPTSLQKALTEPGQYYTGCLTWSFVWTTSRGSSSRVGSRRRILASSSMHSSPSTRFRLVILRKVLPLLLNSNPRSGLCTFQSTSTLQARCWMRPVLPRPSWSPVATLHCGLWS